MKEKKGELSLLLEDLNQTKHNLQVSVSYEEEQETDRMRFVRNDECEEYPFSTSSLRTFLESESEEHL